MKPPKCPVLEVHITVCTICILCLQVWSATFDSSSANIRHPYFPFPTGARLEYRGTGSAAGFTLTHAAVAVESVDGVRCVKIAKRPSTEPESYFWIAQSTDGAIWQLRMHDGLTKEYSEVDALFLMSDPVVGSTCGLGFESSDELVVVGLDGVAEVPLGRFGACVVLDHDWGGGTTRYFLARGAGFVLIQTLSESGTVEGGLQLVASTLGGADNQRPTVAITWPRPNARLAENTIEVLGKASDNVAVSKVWFVLNHSAPLQTSGTYSWAVPGVRLSSGTNWLEAWSEDSSGNKSLTASLWVFLAANARLELHTNGPGSILPNKFTGDVLEVGKSYSVTAKPSQGYLFAGWTGSIATNTATLVFVMQPGMILQANFVPNPFMPVKGTYSGMVADPGSLSPQRCGFFAITVTDKGVYTGSLQLGGGRYTVSGRFDSTGQATASATSCLKINDTIGGSKSC